MKGEILLTTRMHCCQSHFVLILTTANTEMLISILVSDLAWSLFNDDWVSTTSLSLRTSELKSTIGLHRTDSFPANGWPKLEVL